MRRVQIVVGVLLVILLTVWALAACGEDQKTEEKAEDGKTAAERFQKGNEYAQNGEYDNAVVEYKAALEVDPEHVSAMTNLGVVYYNTGKLDAAIEQYTNALAIAPEDADIHSNLAAAQVQKGELDKALEEYLTAVDLDPDLGEAHFGLGVVYVQLGQDDKAMVAFERFQELDTGRDPMASDQAEQYLEQLRGQ